LLEKDIVSNMNFEEEEINPHNEVSGIYPAKNEESHAICESLLSQQSLLQVSELKNRILKMLPHIVEH
jgi:hypothetical protein